MMVDPPAGAFRRLTEHYGPSVQTWLREIRTTLAAAAERWQVRLIGCHDAGWTSIVAVGIGAQDRAVLIKASPDLERYQQERAALLHWRDVSVNRLLDFDDGDRCLLLDAVAGVPGANHGPPTTNGG